jgi:hypothetical protein
LPGPTGVGLGVVPESVVEPETVAVPESVVVVASVCVPESVVVAGEAVVWVTVVCGGPALVDVVFVAGPGTTTRGCNEGVSASRQATTVTPVLVEVVWTPMAGGRQAGTTPRTARPRTSRTSVPARIAGMTRVRPLGIWAGRILARIVPGDALTQFL